MLVDRHRLRRIHHTHTNRYGEFRVECGDRAFNWTSKIVQGPGVVHEFENFDGRPLLATSTVHFVTCERCLAQINVGVADGRSKDSLRGALRVVGWDRESGKDSRAEQNLAPMLSALW